VALLILGVADIDRLVGDVVAGWACNEANPLIFNDADDLRS
jgi:hypothetical protein